MGIYNKLFIAVNVGLLLLIVFLAGVKIYDKDVVLLGELKDFGVKELGIMGFGGDGEEGVEPVKMLVMGDLMLGRYVETLMRRHGAEYPFINWSKFDLEQDVIVGNLEGPIPASHVHTPDYTTNFSFDRNLVVPLLKEKGITHLGIANNHTLDKGEDAFWNTKKVLQEEGILAFGNPNSVSEEWVLSDVVNGQEIVWVGVNEAVSPYFDAEKTAEVLKKVHENQPEALIFAYVHWGNEYQLTSNKKQKELARLFVDAGADVIVGHHPHVRQEIEMYKGRFIFYSLGNFIFDQYFSKDTQEGFVVYLEVFPGEMKARLEPIEIEQSRPAPMGASNGKLFLEKLANDSSEEVKQMILDNNLYTKFN